MNPIYDLIVIGVISSMVLLNLYFFRSTGTTKSSWTALAEKLSALNLLGQRSVLSSSEGSPHLSRR